MEKLIELTDYFYDTYEPTVQVVDKRCMQSLEKTASEAFEYIKSVNPEQGKRFILVIAMGAGETWGANKNADYFPEADLLKQFKNFETQFDNDGKINGGALIFKHHRNKLAKGHPWFGTVKKAFWNPRMKRVELLLVVHEDKALDLVSRIDRGETIAVSMGVRIPYDVCSICGNKAKTRKQYCDDLKLNLRKILPDGRKVYAINGGYDYSKHKKPLNFFDISMVFRPADQTGYMLKKVAEFDDGEATGSAELAEKLAFLSEKIAVLRKLSDMDKIVKGVPVASKSPDGELKVVEAYKDVVGSVAEKMQPLSEDKVEQLSKFPMNKILSTLSHNNIILTTPEFVSLIMTKLTGKTIPPEDLRRIAQYQGEYFDQLADDPDELEKMSAYDMFQDVSPDEKIGVILEDIKDNRDLSDQGFYKKAGTDITRAGLGLEDASLPWGDGKGMLQSETMIDPSTGKPFRVSMESIEDAKWHKLLKSTGTALGSSLLLGGAYLALKAQNHPLAPVAGLASLAMGAHGLKDVVTKDPETGYMRTEEGSLIPQDTVMIEKKSAIMPYIGQAIGDVTSTGTARGLAVTMPGVTTALLNRYYDDRLQKGVAGTYRTDLEKNLDTAGQAAYVHPLLVGATGTLAGGLGLKHFNRLRKSVFGR